jgi:putative membrane protein
MDAEIPDDKRATEHLANERTFLAWVRTSLAIMSLGFVVAKFGLWLRELAGGLPLRTPVHGSGLSAPFGTAMIGFGGLLAILAGVRFHLVTRQIERGKVKVDRGLVQLVTLAIAALALAMMVYITVSTATQP